MVKATTGEGFIILTLLLVSLASLSSGLDCPSNSISVSNNTLCECNIGYGGNAETGVCNECLNGFFKSEVGNTECSACPAYSDTNNTIGSTSQNSCVCLAGFGGDAATGECVACSYGFYKSASNSLCSACPGNSSTDTTNSTSVSSCRCNAGYSGSAAKGSGCLACPNGYFKTSNSDGNCNACPKNSDTNGDIGSFSSDACSCISGYEGNATSVSGCSTCKNGFYKSSSGNSACAACPLYSDTKGTTGSTSRSACLCLAGFGGNATTEGCLACAQGFYKGGKSKNVACTACTENSNTTSINSTSQSACGCNAGYGGTAAKGKGACTACADGFYKSSFGDGSCTACPKSSDTRNMTASVSQLSCSCSPGYEGVAYSGTEGCTACTKGSFGVGGNSSCIECPLFSDTKGKGSPSQSACTCEAGYEGNATVGNFSCTVCSIGFYKSSGNGLCVACPGNSSNAINGSTTQKDCTCYAGYGGNAASGKADCTVCGFGFYSAVGNTDCTECPANSNTTFETATNQSMCSCAPGYSGVAAVGKKGCTACADGFYKDSLKDDVCTACPDNSTTGGVKGSTSVFACGCSAGFEGFPFNSTGCKACEAGFYKEAGSGYCMACPLNSDTANMTASTSQAQCQCLAGYSGNAAKGQGACQICPYGSYKSERGNFDCTACPANSNTTYLGALSQTDCLCNLGYSGNASSGDKKACSACPDGTYKSTVGEGLCVACPNNSDTSGNTASDSEAYCKCSAGFEGTAVSNTTSDSPTCVACQDGFYKAAGDGLCISCPGNSTTGGLNASTSQKSCQCKAGYGGNAASGQGACQLCDYGFYSGEGNVGGCTACPSNSNTTITGALDQSTCLCNPGFIGNASVGGNKACSACPDGSFKFNLGPGVCQTCPNNSYTGGNSGSSSSLACVCSAGYEGYAEGNATTPAGCTACQDGFYKSGGDGPCISCPGNSTTAGVTASTSQKQCICIAGYGGNAAKGQGACTLCDYGYYSSAGNTGGCIECPSNSNTTILGSVDQSTCLCNPGFVGNASTGGNKACSACPDGFYKDTLGLGVCQACPNNSYTSGNTGSTSSSACVCSAGYEGFAEGNATTQAGCTACQDGFYKSGGDGYCSSCPGNSTTGMTAATSQKQCVCKPGFGGNAAKGQGDCELCGYGFFSGGDNSDCTKCPSNSNTTIWGAIDQSSCLCLPGYSGNASVGGNNACSACPDGTYKSTLGSDICQACPNNSYTGGHKGSTSFSFCECSAGYEGNATSSGCAACGDGFYKSGGDGVCTGCPGNSTTAGIIGSTSQKSCQCNAGFGGNAASGQGSCQVCNYGSYSSIGNSGCTSCPSNSNSTVLGAVDQSYCSCNAGYTGNATVGGNKACSACLDGFYKSYSGSDNCTSCPSNSNTKGAKGSTSKSACACITGYYGNATDDAPCTACPFGSQTIGKSGSGTCYCSAGYEGDASVAACSPCKNGFYKSDVANGACVACPGNSNTMFSNSTSQSACLCNAGYGGNAAKGKGACVECGYGSYSHFGNDGCSACPGFSNTTSTTSVNQTACACLPGYGGLAGTSKKDCSACSDGTYKSTFADGVCSACPNNTDTGGAKASTSASSCVCEAGYEGSAFGPSYCTACKDGFYKAGGDGSCTACPPNSNTGGNNGATSQSYCQCFAGFGGNAAKGLGACVECDYGSYSIGGNSGCKGCPSHSNTTTLGSTVQSACLCNPGYGGNASTGSKACSVCPNGFFKSDFGQGDCQACPANSDTNGVTGLTSSTACSCLPGFAGDAATGGACIGCQNGQFKAGHGNLPCQVCPANSDTSGKNASNSQSDCVCKSGFGGDASKKNATCVECPPGTTKLAGNDECEVCPSFSSIINGGCVCSAGYGADKGNKKFTCKACGVGYYKNTDSNDACTACPSNSNTGSIVNSTSQSNCTCVAGYVGYPGLPNSPGCAKAGVIKPFVVGSSSVPVLGGILEIYGSGFGSASDNITVSVEISKNSSVACTNAVVLNNGTLIQCKITHTGVTSYQHIKVVVNGVVNKDTNVAFARQAPILKNLYYNDANPSKVLITGVNFGLEKNFIQVELNNVSCVTTSVTDSRIICEPKSSLLKRSVRSVNAETAAATPVRVTVSVNNQTTTQQLPSTVDKSVFSAQTDGAPTKGLTGGSIAGIVIGVIIGVILLVLILYKFVYLNRRSRNYIRAEQGPVFAEQSPGFVKLGSMRTSMGIAINDPITI